MSKLLVFFIVLMAVGGLVAYSSIQFLLELWWFHSLGLSEYFLLRESYSASIVTGKTLVFGGLIYFNLWLVPKTLSLKPDYSKSRLMNNIVAHKGKLFLILTILLALPIGISFFSHWESFLFYVFSAESELTDPIYHKPISYYFFSYPIYELVQDLLLVVFAVLLAVVSFLYRQFYKNIPDKSVIFPQAAKLHLVVLLAILVFLQAWSITLEFIEMLYEDRHLPVFFGPGFIEMGYQRFLIWLSFGLFLMAVLSVIYRLYFGKGIKIALGLIVAHCLVLVIKQATVIPDMIDEYYVKPNPVKAEGRYIKHHVKATLEAFKLNEVKEIDYPLDSSLAEHERVSINRDLYNIPLWDDNLLLPVYEQLQSIRPYFNFYQVSVDRYHLNGHTHQVNVGVRELDYKNLPKNAQNWRNQHLIYTHGYGVVATPSEQQGNKPMQWLLYNLSHETGLNKFVIKQPEIYYGLADYQYAIVPNSVSLKAEDKTAGDMNNDYQGNGGLKLSSIFIKAVVAGFLKDEKVFFSSSITNESRILVRRNIFKRIKAIAPFLTLDKEAYPVIVEGKVYWIIDAYTHSDRYPLVEPLELTTSHQDEAQQVSLNYVRNSVKIIVDAYNGSVDFYIVDEKDPIIATYNNLYPMLFKGIADVPKSFIKHFSYPQGLFELQMRVYSRFHQTNPNVFYQQSEALELARMDDKPISPYYLTLDIYENPDIPVNKTQKFILVSPLSPKGRDNLEAVAIAGCLNTEHCDEHYQEDIYVYKLPQQIQVEGPEQINALIDQNPEISSQYTLWDQRGSKVIKGRIIIAPAGQSLLYIQPLYLAATSATGFPSLAKVIVVMNRQAVIADTLPQAFEAIQKKLAK